MCLLDLIGVAGLATRTRGGVACCMHGAEIGVDAGAKGSFCPDAVTSESVFSTGSFNFQQTGMRCPHASGSIHARGTLAGLMGDEQSVKDTWCVKGASGTKPCLHCKNIVGRLELGAGHEYLRTLANPRIHECDLHNDASFNNKC